MKEGVWEFSVYGTEARDCGPDEPQQRGVL